MSRFERIGIHGFRRLFDVEVEMRPLTVMVGANGAGKTSFLDVFSLLAASASGRLDDKLAEFGGLSDLLTRDRSQSLEFSLQMSTAQEPLEYYLKFALRGQGYEIRSEMLTQRTDPQARQPFKHIDSHGSEIRYYNLLEKGLVRPNWEHKSFETSLYQVPKMYEEPERLRTQLASCTRYGALNVDAKSLVRLPQRMRPVKLPGADGEDLVSCLYYLRESDPDRFEIVEDTLEAAFPDFQGLKFPPIAAGMLAMTWKDKNFNTPLYMHQLSEGTLRFLWLATLLQNTELSAITMIDEPEVSLHPALLSLLVDLMREASDRSQLILATHSDRLIRFLRPSEVLVCDLEPNAETQMNWADSMDLDQWLADYSLDEVWSMNVIGGRP